MRKGKERKGKEKCGVEEHSSRSPPPKKTRHQKKTELPKEKPFTREPDRNIPRREPPPDTTSSGHNLLRA
jgi:hypothetical protein